MKPHEHLRKFAHALETADVPAGPLIASAYMTAAESLEQSWPAIVAKAREEAIAEIREPMLGLVEAAEGMLTRRHIDIGPGTADAYDRLRAALDAVTATLGGEG